jgi:type IV pilus assembly protein PilE
MDERVMTRRKQAGVTLIELMIAVAIVAILAAIAYPSYQRYVVRTHRNSASACLSQYAQFMERHYTANLTYVGAAPGNLACARENDLDRRYTIGIRGTPTARAYILDATPRDTQAAQDAACGTLTINQTGARSVSGTAGRDACWR